MENKIIDKVQKQQENLKKELFRYLSFWPWFIVSLILTISATFLYLRYAENMFSASAQIQIIDKSQDSEMALPTSMTIFNRSMINLENEIGKLSSNTLHEKAVKSIDANIKFYSVGLIKTTQNHKDDWFNNYDLNFKCDTDTISNYLKYTIKTSQNNNFSILYVDENYDFFEYNFENGTTKSNAHNLPFELTLNDFEENITKILEVTPINSVVNALRKQVNVLPVGKDSDQLSLSLVQPNFNTAIDYLNTLIFEFNKDGVNDRQLEYKNTIRFVDVRAVVLSKELAQIELKKQNFKKQNNLSDIEADAAISITEQFEYDNELFFTESQRDLSEILLSSVSENNYDLLPVNIGVNSSVINSIISEFNMLVLERDKFLISAGKNNSYVKSIERQLDNYLSNIFISIDNFQKELDLKISNLRKKEQEFVDIYNSVPENEKILRSIERELSVKESLFVLLLQKREEAAINLAVVKPTIKIIDPALSSKKPVSPIPLLYYGFSILIGLIIPFSILYLWFFFDQKIHTKSQLIDNLRSDIAVLSEIPFINQKSDLNKIYNAKSRSQISESIRMLIANLKFTLNFIKNDCKVILVTSSVKGEGKTIISTNTASILSYNSKTLLIGADLRNPQIHKLLKTDKTKIGLSDLIYKNDHSNYKDYLVKHDNLDILLSGTIPPNPSEILSSVAFKELIFSMRKRYDYIIIDSAPCLLVSDTINISSEVYDSSIYVVRANHSNKELCRYIEELFSGEKLINMNLVLNAVGNSSRYGYKYGYQYGYQYGYNYRYNYGYGYGYEEDKK